MKRDEEIEIARRVQTNVLMKLSAAHILEPEDYRAVYRVVSNLTFEELLRVR